MKNEDAPPQLADVCEVCFNIKRGVAALAGKISGQQHCYDNFI